MDPDRENAHVVSNVGEVLERCGVCCASDKAPHVPIAGTPAVSKFNGKLQEDLSFLDGIIAMRAMDGYSKYSLLAPALSGNLQEVRDAVCGAWTGVFGPRLVGERGVEKTP